MMHAIVTDDQRVTRSCLLLFIDRVRFLFVSYRAPSERGVKSITPDTRESERANVFRSSVKTVAALRESCRAVAVTVGLCKHRREREDDALLCFRLRDGDPATRASNALARVCAPMVERGASCNLERARRGNQRDNGLLHQS
jgi:hypothetical protein